MVAPINVSITERINGKKLHLMEYELMISSFRGMHSTYAPLILPLKSVVSNPQRLSSFDPNVIFIILALAADSRVP